MWVPLRIERFIQAVIDRLDAIREALQKQESTICDASVSAEKQGKEPPVSIAAAISELRIPIEEREKTAADEDKRHRENLKQQRWLTGWTAAAFLAAAIYAAIAKKQLDQTAAATKAAQCGARAAQEALGVARAAEARAGAAEKLDERPWISLQEALSCIDCSHELGPALGIGSPGPRPSQTETLKLPHGLTGDLANSGKTPALHAKIEFFSFTRPIPLTQLPDNIAPTFESVVGDWQRREKDSLAGLSPKERQKAMDFTGYSHLGPYDRSTWPPMSIAPGGASVFLNLMPGGILTREIFDDDRKVIFIIGKITYYDSTTPQADPPPYVTTFCLENIAWDASGFGLCRSGNDMK